MSYQQRTMMNIKVEVFRRIMSVICAISNSYKVYFSKVKKLGEFWLASALINKKELQATLKDGDIDEKRVFLEEDHMFFSLKAFNSLIKHYSQVIPSRLKRSE